MQESKLIHDSLPLEKTLFLHNIIILVKYVFNKNKNHYYYNISLEKRSYREHKNNAINTIHKFFKLMFTRITNAIS